MPTKIKNRREDSRSQIPEFLEAELEFAVPDGSTRTYPLIDLSVSGASFRLPQRLPGIGAGKMVERGLIRFGEIEIRVHLEVLHVTRMDASCYVCGVRLYPANEDGRNELISLVSRLGSVPS